VAGERQVDLFPPSAHVQVRSHERRHHRLDPSLGGRPGRA
jgi:hypothetical protein